MNVYIYELKSQWKNSVIWALGMLITLVLFMKGVYPIYQDSQVDIQKLLEGYPKGFLDIFGMNLDSLFRFQGFYGFTYVYIGLVAAIMAVTLSVSVFGREKKMKCLDFIFTKPISKRRLFAAKMGAILTWIGLVNAVYLLVNLLIYMESGEQLSGSKQYLIACLGVFFTQIVFVTIGACLAVYMKKIRSVAGMGTAVGFLAFIVNALANLTGKEVIHYISPLYYFHPDAIAKIGHYRWEYVVTAIVFVGVGTAITYIRFCKSDIHSV